MIACTVCGEWSPALGPDRLDICAECYTQNFAGTLPESPTARQALDAYVSSAHPLTPREVQAMAWMTDIWRRQMEEDAC